jgi:hypothetical protein
MGFMLVLTPLHYLQSIVTQQGNGDFIRRAVSFTAFGLSCCGKIFEPGSARGFGWTELWNAGEMEFQSE